MTDLHPLLTYQNKTISATIKTNHTKTISKKKQNKKLQTKKQDRHQAGSTKLMCSYKGKYFQHDFVLLHDDVLRYLHVKLWRPDS